MRRPRRTALIGAVVIAVVLTWIGATRLLSEQGAPGTDDPSCLQPATADAAGLIPLGPLALTGLTANEGARLELDRGQTRTMVMHQDPGSRELTLRMTACDGSGAARLVAIGADGAISLPSRFPSSAGAEEAPLRGQHRRYFVVVLGAHPGRWRISVVDAEDQRLGSVVVELVASR